MKINPLMQSVIDLLKDADCVLAYETAADFLGICNGCSQRPYYIVYSKKELDISDVKCVVVDSYAGLDVQEILGMQCTTPVQTIRDLIVNDRDDQIIYESMADWYYKHGESFEGLSVPSEYQELFDWYAEGAKEYYCY